MQRREGPRDSTRLGPSDWWLAWLRQRRDGATRSTGWASAGFGGYLRSSNLPLGMGSAECLAGSRVGPPRRDSARLGSKCWCPLASVGTCARRILRLGLRLAETEKFRGVAGWFAPTRLGWARGVCVCWPRWARAARPIFRACAGGRLGPKGFPGIAGWVDSTQLEVLVSARFSKHVCSANLPRAREIGRDRKVSPGSRAGSTRLDTTRLEVLVSADSVSTCARLIFRVRGRLARTQGFPRVVGWVDATRLTRTPLECWCPLDSVSTCARRLSRLGLRLVETEKLGGVAAWVDPTRLVSNMWLSARSARGESYAWA